MVKKKDLCILHIGMPKTGSSTIQRNFFHNSKNTETAYPNIGIANNGTPFYAIFKKDIENYYFIKNKLFNADQLKDYRAELIEKFNDSFLDKNTKNALISGEAMFHASVEEIQEMKNYLDSFFEKTLVLVYVRPVQSFCNSAFQQLLKYHDLCSFDDTQIVPKYKNIQRYDDIYGLDNVKVIPFLPKHFPDGDIMKDFCKHAKLQEQASSIEAVNESLSKEAISILFTYNYHHNVKTDFGDKNVQIQNILVEKLRKIGNKKFQFSGKLIQRWIEEYFKEDYVWLLDRIGSEYSENFAINTTIEGTETEMELMEYSTEYIDELIAMITHKSIAITIKKNPQTVAKLVNMIRMEIAEEIKL